MENFVSNIRDALIWQGRSRHRAMAARARNKPFFTKQVLANRNPRMEATCIQVTPGYGNGSTREVRYVDAKVIGKGSFGVVYMATLYDSKEKVAIKKVKQDKRYKNRELQIMRRLEHPNVVKLLYYFYTNQGEDYLNLILEFIPRTLHQINRVTDPIPEFFKKLYMFQMFRALSFMHSFSICHRDIKPQNLLVDQDYGVLKICDFGSAKMLADSGTNVSYICSRYYRAPELIYGSERYSTAIDLWSAGTVMAELYLYQPLFRGDAATTQLQAIVSILGVPTKEELEDMSNTIKEKEYPRVKPTGLDKSFPSDTPSNALSIITRLLKFSPKSRLTAAEVMAESYFNALRKPDLKYMPNGNLMPRLFDWYEREYNIRPDLNKKIHPRVEDEPEIDPEEISG